MTLDLDPDRRLALAYASAAARPALEALWRLDVTFASVLATGRDRMVGRIRLAWWSEALERLDREASPPELVLRALQAHVLPAGIAGAELAAMAEGWEILLAEEPLDAGALGNYAAGRGGALFALSSRLLGDSRRTVDRAGASWALVDLARHSSNADEARLALEEAARLADDALWPRRLRPLGMLSVLTLRDLRRGAGSWESPGSPGRMLRMLRHRLTGT
ncbi:MAG TPA: squalene/phytoene synthase family protein [Allosphingosinicella sp.]|nr:squalene/phytoene synthase family protein [Allosphingosinicella sp.]